MSLLVAEAVFVVEFEGEVLQPQKVVVGFFHPPYAGVVLVRGSVGGWASFFIEGGAHDLRAFEDHLYDVLVAVVSCAGLDVVVENEYIHLVLQFRFS